MALTEFPKEGVVRNSSRIGLVSVAVAQAVGLQALVLAAPSGAQSPKPTFYSYDVAPGSGFPGAAPYATHTPNAVVIEGLGSLGCTSYSASSIEFYTDVSIDDGYQTVTEITPQAGCGNTTAYKDLVLEIYENVETTASEAGRFWGGFMFDEEPGYGFAPATLESLNRGTETLMTHTTGLGFYFTEDEPNGWSSLSTYKEIVEGSWEAPQAYSATMANTINQGCATYGTDGLCTQMMTVHTQASTGITYPWTDYSYVTTRVFGYPLRIPGWGTGGWWNAYQNA
ncbi:MAG: hypothetical protein ACRDZR_04015 [Acidimicrobiales bacterium]